jgi:alkylglycerol monooxygenase
MNCMLRQKENCKNKLYRALLHWMQQRFFIVLFYFRHGMSIRLIMEQKKWVFYLEYLRFIIVLLIPFYSLHYWQLQLSILIVLLLVLLTWHESIQQKYYQYVYRRLLTE